MKTSDIIKLAKVALLLMRPQLKEEDIDVDDIMITDTKQTEGMLYVGIEIPLKVITLNIIISEEGVEFVDGG